MAKATQPTQQAARKVLNGKRSNGWWRREKAQNTLWIPETCRCTVVNIFWFLQNLKWILCLIMPQAKIGLCTIFCSTSTQHLLNAYGLLSFYHLILQHNLLYSRIYCSYHSLVIITLISTIIATFKIFPWIYVLIYSTTKDNMTNRPICSNITKG